MKDCDEKIEIERSVKMVEYYVQNSFIINGIKALHMSYDSVRNFNDWDEVSKELEHKGYDVRSSKFKSGSRLGAGEIVHVEVSIKPVDSGYKTRSRL